MTAPLILQFFGPMDVVVDGRPLPHLRSRKARWLLALLTLRGGRPVGREWVAGMLWPDADLSIALANMRPVVSELRRAMGSQGVRLQTPDRKTIALDLDEADVDLLRFDQAIEKGDFESAAALYRGPLLEDCPEEWVPQERATREKACLAALRKLAQSESSSGRFEAAVIHCQRAVSIAPGQDALRRDLMEALAKAGDLNAALQTYRDFAQLLRATSGASPDPKTTDLYFRLRSDGSSRERPARPSASEPAAPKGRLPHPLTALIGREDERIEIAERLRHHRFVTLTGLGGIGKTRLAQEVALDVATDFPDGVWFVPLDSVAVPNAVATQITSVMGLKDEPGTSLDGLIADMRPKRLLLILDNCEHLVTVCARICERVLAECGGVRILATSRQALGVVGERVWSVPALTVPDPAHLPSQGATLLRVAAGYEGVRLFVERAQGVRDGFALSRENAHAVASICAQVEGIPLAIELAAARIRSMSVDAIDARLREHLLEMLQGTSHGSVPRHQTLRATLDWSYALLEPKERTLLERMSVFVGGWTLAAAESVGTDSEIRKAEIPDLIEQLVDKSLIRFTETADGGRYTMLETVRQFARPRLQDAEGTLKRLREWCMEFAREAAIHYKGPGQGEWIRRTHVEHGNLRTVLDTWQGRPAERIELCLALTGFWWRTGHFAEGRRYLEAAISDADLPELVRERASALVAAGLAAWNQRDLPSASGFLEASMEIRQEQGDRSGLAECLRVLGAVSMYQGRFRLSVEHYERCLLLAEEIGEPRQIALAYGNLGILARLMGDTTRARTLYDEAVARYRLLEDPLLVVNGLIMQGNIGLDLGDYGFARAQFDEASSLLAAQNFQNEQASLTYSRGHLAEYLESYAEARLLHARALEIYQELGDELYVANCLNGQGNAALGEGDLDAAIQFAEEGVRRFRKCDHSPGIARTLTDLAVILVAQNRLEAANEAIREALALQKDLPDKRGVAANLTTLAQIAAANRDDRLALRRIATAESIRETHGWNWSPPRRRQIRSLCDAIESRLDPRDYLLTWNEGAALNWEDALDRELEIPFNPLPTSVAV